MIKKIALFLFLFLPFVAHAQDGPNASNTLDPNNPVLSDLSDEELLAEVRRRREAALRNVNDLDADEIDRWVVNDLDLKFMTEPKEMQVNLDLTDSQFEEVQAVLLSMRAVYLDVQNQQIDAMCGRWNVDNLSSFANESAKISDALEAYDATWDSKSSETYTLYQSALSDIREIVGDQQAFDRYINSRRDVAKTAKIVTFSESVGMFGTAKETLNFHCKGGN